jgi:purine-binding chemotaxis protein CheW
MGSNDPRAAEGPTGEQILTFRLGTETYGLNILKVKEIRGWLPVTRIPQAPAHMLGMLNLRGAIVPIFDLRLRFALESAEFSAKTVVIVLSLQTAAGPRECGVVVDSVSDVVDIAAGAIKPPPALSGQEQSHYIQGLVNVDNGMLILLNVEELVSQDLNCSEAEPTAACAA